MPIFNTARELFDAITPGQRAYFAPVVDPVPGVVQRKVLLTDCSGWDGEIVYVKIACLDGEIWKRASGIRDDNGELACYAQIVNSLRVRLFEGTTNQLITA